MNKTTEALKLAEEIFSGLLHGTDWNNGTHANIYRPKFPKALAAIRETLADHVEQSLTMVADHSGDANKMVYSKPSVFDGVCCGCSKKAADGYALYCVECWEKSNGDPFAASGKLITKQDHIAGAGKMVGCAYCDNPLFAGTKCNNCGRVTLAEPVNEICQPDSNCVEADGCPTELVVLQRFWREQKAEPVKFLCNGTRYKVQKLVGDVMICGLPDELIGEWVALVDATDGKHLRAEPVKQEPVAWHEPNAYGNVTTHKKWALENGWLPLYAAPVQPVKQEPVFNADDLYSIAGRLALELECLLMDTKDMSVVSKWWDSAHEALEQWRSFHSAPVQPVKQEPVAWTNYNGAVNNRLKGAPVDAKAIRAEAYQQGRNEMKEEAAKVCDEHAAKAKANGYTVKGETFIDGFGDGSCACASAIRGLK